jgi:hypothetical protein
MGADVGEIIKALSAVATAGAAWFAAYTAYRGLEKWRAETIGKRKAELAEEVLADFYEARDIINAVRLPGGFVDEGSTRQRESWETPDDTKMLNAYFATVERLTKKAEFFARLHARRYRVRAVFAKGATAPYDDLSQIHSQIVAAVRLLITTYRHPDRGRGQALDRNRQSWETIMGWGLDEEKDPIPRLLDQIVEAIEHICQPAIRARGGKQT